MKRAANSEIVRAQLAEPEVDVFTGKPFATLQGEAKRGVDLASLFLSLIHIYAVMNLAEPSGSSPPEKPTGIMTIWDSLMRRASSRVDSATFSGVRLLITKTSASAPAARKARAESNSQLLPGKTGMITRGLAILRPQMCIRDSFRTVESLVREGKALSVSTAGFGGLAEILFKACLRCV